MNLNTLNHNGLIQVGKALCVLLILQLLFGFGLIVANCCNSILSDLTSLAIVIILFIFGVYIWLIPFYFLLLFIRGIYKRKQYPSFYFIVTSLIIYLLYFSWIYRGMFWQLSCLITQCSFSEWLTSERIDYFFNIFSLLSVIYFITNILRLKTNEVNPLA